MKDLFDWIIFNGERKVRGGVIFLLFFLLMALVGIASAKEADQVTFCQFTSLNLCEIKGADCIGGDTPEQAERKLGRKPSAIIQVPDDYQLHAEAHIYVANSGKHIYLEFRDGHLFSAANDYVAWLDSSKRCGLDL